MTPEPSFRKRAWHSCSTFSRPPGPPERKEDPGEHTESQGLLPAVRVGRAKGENRTGEDTEWAGEAAQAHRDKQAHPDAQP